MGQHLPFSLDVLSDRFLACTACRKSKFGKGRLWVLPAPPPMGFLTAAAGLLPSSAVVIIRLSEGFVKGAGPRPGGMPLYPPCPRPAFPDAFAARFYAMGKVQKRGVSTIVTNCICSIWKKRPTPLLPESGFGLPGGACICKGIAFASKFDSRGRMQSGYTIPRPMEAYFQTSAYSVLVLDAGDPSR